MARAPFVACFPPFFSSSFASFLVSFPFLLFFLRGLFLFRDALGTATGRSQDAYGAILRSTGWGGGSYTNCSVQYGGYGVAVHGTGSALLEGCFIRRFRHGGFIAWADAGVDPSPSGALSLLPPSCASVWGGSLLNIYRAGLCANLQYKEHLNVCDEEPRFSIFPAGQRVHHLRLERGPF